MKNLLLQSFTVACVLLLFTACQDVSTNELSKEQKVVDTLLTEDNFNSVEYDFIIPSPLALYKSFNSITATSNFELLNAPENLDSYTNKSIQLLNFGIYSTDLAHCVLNSKQQEVTNYLLVLEELANRVGMGSIFNDVEVREKIEANLGNKEELEALLFEIHEKSQEYLEDNELRYMASVQFCGAWLEGVYLGMAALEIIQDTTSLSTILDSQMTLLDNCIHVLSDYPSKDEHIARLRSSLTDLQTMYAQFTGVHPDVENQLLTPIQLNEVKEKITEIRNSLI